MRVLVLLVAAALVSAATRIPAPSAAAAGRQFGGRKGCCWKPTRGLMQWSRRSSRRRFIRAPAGSRRRVEPLAPLPGSRLPRRFGHGHPAGARRVAGHARLASSDDLVVVRTTGGVSRV